MSNSQAVCGYKVTAVGGQPITALAAALAAAPLDVSWLVAMGLLPIKDQTVISGSSATRSVTLQFVPHIPAAATTQLRGGSTGSGPIETLTVVNPGANGDYARTPIVSFIQSGPESSGPAVLPYPAVPQGYAVDIGLKKNATAAAIMQVQDAFILNGGSGYSAQSTAAVVGGEVAPTGRVATATLTINAGVVGGVTFTDPGVGYNSFPQVVVTDPLGTGTGAVIFAGLGVVDLMLHNRGEYGAAPTLVFTPAFPASYPDSSQQTCAIAEMMSRSLAEVLRSPVISLAPVIT